MLPPSDQNADEASRSGGKAGNLLKLKKHFRVPEFFVITPDEKLDDVSEKFDKLGAKRVAVRSSAVNEDSKDAAWAGQLETVLNVERNGLLEAIQTCRESASSERAKAYAATHGVQSGGVAVIVQKMVESRVSGVAFSKHPVTGGARVVIEAVRGLGEQLVSGQVTPDTYIEGREQHLVGNEAILAEQELAEIVELTKKVENFFNYPVDIEWAYEGDMLYLLQARPITTV